MTFWMWVGAAGLFLTASAILALFIGAVFALGSEDEDERPGYITDYLGR